MKICKKCGAYNSNDIQSCVDCNERLSKAISVQQEQLLKVQINEKTEKLFNKNDPLNISFYDKIIGFASIAFIAILIIFGIISLITMRNIDFILIGILFFILTIIECFVPKILWGLEKFRLSFTISNADDAEPSDFYRICRRVSILIFVAVGALMIGITIYNFTKPPVVKYIHDIANTQKIYSHSSQYINDNPEKWKAIIDSKDYTVSIFLAKLEDAQNTGLEERLMMDAIMEIKGVSKDIYFNNKDDFLMYYSTFSFDNVQFE